MFIIRYKKWYWRFMPHKRKRLKVLQSLVNHVTETPEFKERLQKKMTDYLLYGEN